MNTLNAVRERQVLKTGIRIRQITLKHLLPFFYNKIPFINSQHTPTNSKAYLVGITPSPLTTKKQFFTLDKY